MEAALDRHSGAAVLEAAARAYLSLCGEETARFSVSRAARDSLVQRWVEQLSALLEVKSRCIFRPGNYGGTDAFTAPFSICLSQADSFSADEEKTGELLVTLRKLGAFHK